MATNLITLYDADSGNWANFAAFLSAHSAPAYDPSENVIAIGTGHGGDGQNGQSAVGGVGGGGGEWAKTTATIDPGLQIDIFIDVSRTALYVDSVAFMEANAGASGASGGAGGTGGTGDITHRGGNGGSAAFLGGAGGGGCGDDVGDGNPGGNSAGANGAPGGASGDLSSFFGGDGGSSGISGEAGDDGCGGGGGRGSASNPTAGGAGGRAWMTVSYTILETQAADSDSTKGETFKRFKESGFKMMKDLK